MARLSLLIFLAAVIVVAADDGVFGQIKSYLWTESVRGCPFGVFGATIGAGTRCPETGFFSFYTCCKDAGSECCFRLQGWVVFIIVSLLVSLFISCVGSIISCICCCGRRD